MPVIEERRIVELDDGDGNKTRVLVETPKQGRPELYTETYCHQLFKNINDYLMTRRDIYTITGLLAEMKIPASKYYVIFDKFPDVKSFREYHENIKSILESRIAEDGIKGKTNATMSIFTLKNKHGWKDKKEHDIAVSHNLGDFLQKIPKSPKALPEATIQANGVFSLMDEKEEE
jgi:hypothetical protein